MSKKADRFGKGAENAFNKASRGANRFSKITKGILAASAIQRTFSLMAQGAQSVVSEFIAFDDSIFSAAAKFSDLDLATKKGQKGLDDLRKAARRVGSETQFQASAAAKALDFLALAGFNSAQAMASLKDLADFATAANMDDFGRVVDIATDSLGAFGLATKDTIQLQKNLTRVSDVFAKTQASSNTTVEALFEAVGKGAAVLSNTGASLETFSALSGVLANSTLKAGEAGTQLRNIMLALADPNKKAAAGLRKLSTTTKDSKNNFRDMIDILDDLGKGVSKLGSAERTKVLTRIFGRRTVTGVSLLLKAGTKQLKQFRKELENSNGASKKMAEIMRLGLGKRIKALTSAATELGFKILDAFKEKGVGGIESLTKAIRDFDVDPIIEGIKGTVDTFKDLFTIMKSVLVITSPLIASMVAYKVIVFATALKMAFLTIGIKLATVAQWLFNIALNANPLGLVVAAVALIGITIALVVLKWKVLKNAFINGGAAIARIFGRIWALIKGIGGFIGSIFDDDVLKDTNIKKTTEIINKNEEFIPPNKEEAKAQSSKFEGILKFVNKPDNIEFKSSIVGAPFLDVEGLGAN